MRRLVSVVVSVSVGLLIGQFRDERQGKRKRIAAESRAPNGLNVVKHFYR